jgi:hypothetical protein
MVATILSHENNQLHHYALNPRNDILWWPISHCLTATSYCLQWTHGDYDRWASCSRGYYTCTHIHWPDWAVTSHARSAYVSMACRYDDDGADEEGVNDIDIQPSKATAWSQVHLVRKPNNGGWRFTIDYRSLNQVISNEIPTWKRCSRGLARKSHNTLVSLTLHKASTKCHYMKIVEHLYCALLCLTSDDRPKKWPSRKWGNTPISDPITHNNANQATTPKQRRRRSTKHTTTCTTGITPEDA